MFNPLSPHDAIKHNFTSLKTDLILNGNVTVMSSEGKQYKAHAGVLAAASAELADELCQCSRGNYTMKIPMKLLY